MTRPNSIKRRYEQGEDRPLGSFLALMGGYGSLVAVAGAILHRKGRNVPARIAASDLAIGIIATHKLARLLAKDPVSSPFRAPFTEFEGQGGEAEVTEKVIGTGLQRAVGDLVTCPFCLDVWVATGLTIGYIASPKLTRTAATVLTIVAGADVLQFGYDALQRTAG